MRVLVELSRNDGVPRAVCDRIEWNDDRIDRGNARPESEAPAVLRQARQLGGGLHAGRHRLGHPLRLTGRLIDPDAPQVHRAAAIAREIQLTPVRRPDRAPVERRVLDDRDALATGCRDGEDVALTAGVAPEGDALPEGDHDGWTASPSAIFRGEPPAASTTQSAVG